MKLNMKSSHTYSLFLKSSLLILEHDLNVKVSYSPFKRNTCILTLMFYAYPLHVLENFVFISAVTFSQRQYLLIPYADYDFWKYTIKIVLA